MEIITASFVKSSSEVAALPPANLPEFAFIGRSNVGKSSLINMLTAVKGLAKTSATPGKTRLFNHFLINDNWYLVDLPGYGYAKLSQTERTAFELKLWTYLLQRQNLVSLFVLIDGRHAPQQIDLAFINRLGAAGVPFALVFTKVDKLSKARFSENKALFEKTLAELWEELPPSFATSATQHTGRAELLSYLDVLLHAPI